jgi:hypothetical protein
VDKNTYLIELSESPRTSFGREPFRVQSEAQRVFTTIFGLQSEVNSGGFGQYFAGSEGETASFAPAAMRMIGAERCANITERALRVVSSGPLPDDRNARNELLDALGYEGQNAMAELDQEFWENPDELTESLFAFVSAHPEAFGPVLNAE